MITTRSINLSEHEVRAALRGELGLVVRPVNGLGGTRPENKLAKCPLGVPGDRLRCRESYYIQDTHGQHRTDGLRWGSWSGLPTTISPDGKRIVYYKEGFDRSSPMWRSPATMPAWALRITLEVEGVRCVRFGELSHADAKLCGLIDDGLGHFIPMQRFWNAKYAKRGLGWETDPFVWAVGVRRAEG